MPQSSAEKMPSVYLYIPNIIGYLRIIINFIAFAVCYSNRPLFAILYFFSFVLDGVDGWFARKFNQASTFGAVLDMVTDSSFLSGKTSHKDVKHTSNWLLKLYYGYRPFMAFCCVSCEVLYIILFLFADEKSTSLLSVCRVVLKQSPLIVLVFISTLVGWAVKQATNIIQMKTAADTCVEFDPKRSKCRRKAPAAFGFVFDISKDIGGGLYYTKVYMHCLLLVCLYIFLMTLIRVGTRRQHAVGRTA